MFKLSFLSKCSYIWAYPFGGMFFIGRCRVRNLFLALFLFPSFGKRSAGGFFLL